MNLAAIETGRAEAQRALAAAEEAMKAGSADPKAFARAKSDRVTAVETLERLDWAEKAERERQVEEAARARRNELYAVQEAASAAHKTARAAAPQLAENVAKLVDLCRRLKTAQETITVGVTHETFALRDGALLVPTIKPKILVDKDVALTVLQAGRSLCILAGMSRAAADQQADQRRL